MRVRVELGQYISPTLLLITWGLTQVQWVHRFCLPRVPITHTTLLVSAEWQSRDLQQNDRVM